MSPIIPRARRTLHTTRLVGALPIAVAFALSGCGGSSMTVNTDFDRSANFSAFKTYSWRDGTKIPNQLMSDRVVAAVDAQLIRSGLQRVDSGGDLTVTYHAATGESTIELVYESVKAKFESDLATVEFDSTKPPAKAPAKSTDPLDAIGDARALGIGYAALYLLIAAAFAVATMNTAVVALLGRFALSTPLAWCVLLVALSEHAAFEVNGWLFSLHRPRIGAVLDLQRHTPRGDTLPRRVGRTLPWIGRRRPGPRTPPAAPSPRPPRIPRRRVASGHPAAVPSPRRRPGPGPTTRRTKPCPCPSRRPSTSSASTSSSSTGAAGPSGPRWA